MNPNTNRFEQLHTKEEREKYKKELDAALARATSGLLRPDGTPVPAHWPIFKVGEQVVIKEYTFKVAYIGETAILFEPVGIPEIGKEDSNA